MTPPVDLDEPPEPRIVRKRVKVRARRKSRRRRRQRARRLWIALAVLGGLVVFGVLATLPALATKARLDEARERIEAGRAALLTGDVEAARTHFFEAEDAFLRASDQARNPLLRLVGFVPILGRTADAVESMGEVGALVARSGRTIADGLLALPGGPTALVPQEGIIDVSAVRQLSPALAEAGDLVAEAEGALEEIPDSLLLDPVAYARARLEEGVSTVRRAVTSAAALARTLPPFLGADGTRRYFVAAQNPAELRGTGGFIGAYAILTVRDGEMRLSGFAPIETLSDVPARRIEPPNPDYAERYDRYGGAGFWRNINMTADFPSAGAAIDRLYERVEGKPLDGTIAADPFALESMLGVVGEARVPRIGETVDAASVVPFLTNEAYRRFPSPSVRKQLLGDVAKSVLERFLESARGPLAFKALADATSAGHLLFHSADREEQRGFEAAGVSGSLGDAGGDYLSLIGNNAAGNKADFYADRSIRYEVRLGAEGTGLGHATVELTNDAPASGQPAYVIGPYSDAFQAGENVTLLDLYCGADCGIEEFQVDGRSATVGSEQELGHQVYPVEVRIPSGETRVLDYGYQLPTAWEGDDGRGTYTLTFRGQTTIRPVPLVIDVRAPEGMEIVGTSPTMEISGGRAVWRGEAPDLMTLEVRFERPLWSRIWNFLSKPVFRLG